MDDLDLGYLMAVSGALVRSPRLLRTLLDELETPRRIIGFARGSSVAPSSTRFGEIARARVASIDDACARRSLRDLEGSGARVVLEADAEYPAAFRDLYDPPPLIYLRGAPIDSGCRCVAIVGSRAATSYGRTVASSMAADFSAYGASVVSGLARGIDASAHEGALRGGARTIAVVGSGLSVLYPSYHADLAARIVDRGGSVLSEFPPTSAARPHHFPMRNRLVAAMAHATIVVEAGARSGALITARLADELGRAVYALPGDVGRPTSAGTNALIKDGVPLITDADDAAGLLGWRSSAPDPISPAEPHDGDGDAFVALIAGGDATVDAIVERTGADVAQVSARLTLLELRGTIRRLGDGSYAPVNESHPSKRRRG